MGKYEWQSQHAGINSCSHGFKPCVGFIQALSEFFSSLDCTAVVFFIEGLIPLSSARLNGIYWRSKKSVTGAGRWISNEAFDGAQARKSGMKNWSIIEWDAVGSISRLFGPPYSWKHLAFFVDAGGGGRFIIQQLKRNHFSTSPMHLGWCWRGALFDSRSEKIKVQNKFKLLFC